jgi:hypothetical protein
VSLTARRSTRGLMGCGRRVQSDDKRCVRVEDHTSTGGKAKQWPHQAGSCGVDGPCTYRRAVRPALSPAGGAAPPHPRSDAPQRPVEKLDLRLEPPQTNVLSSCTHNPKATECRHWVRRSVITSVLFRFHEAHKVNYLQDHIYSNDGRKNAKRCADITPTHSKNAQLCEHC